ncbi:MAG: Mpo1-like protein [Clostridia bacterium]
MRQELSFMEKYKRDHQHPVNKLTHAIGIPMIVISLPLFFWDWKWALGLFILGWIFQFIGHFFEGNPPSFFKNPIFLLVGPLWIVKRLIGFLTGKPLK